MGSIWNLGYKTPKDSLTAGLFIMAGMTLGLIFMHWQYESDLQLLAHGVKIKATVVRLDEHTNKDESVCYYPQVRWILPSDHTTHQSDGGDCYPSGTYHLGSSVTVLYLQGNANSGNMVVAVKDMTVNWPSYRQAFLGIDSLALIWTIIALIQCLIKRRQLN